MRPSYWGNYNSAGNSYYSHGSYDKAATMFQRMIDLTPDNRMGYLNLWAACYMSEQLDRAAEMLLRSIDIAPNASAYPNLGVIYLYKGRYAQSVPMFDKAAELVPQDDWVWGNLADAYRCGAGLQPLVPADVCKPGASPTSLYTI